MEQENFDFYQEALKAFDAPIPQPKKEESAPEPVAEMTEPAPQEKHKRKLNPWWAVALCAILCLALFIGFGQGGWAESRGENCIYGIILEYGEGYVTLVTPEAMWYVELEGLEAPAVAPGALLTDRPTQPLWAFYDGEPEETDQKGCTKKITATFWKTETEFYDSEDEISFDLDGDGRKEVYSLHYTRALPSLYASSFVYRVSLTAKDAQGNILHSVYFDSTEAMSMVFSDAHDRLSLVLYCSGTYEKLDIRLENGELAVYHDGEALKLIPNLTDPGQTQPPVTKPTWTVPLITEPPTTSPTEPTEDRSQNYTIQFFLGNRHMPDEGALTSKLNLLTDEEGEAFKAQLNDLTWRDGGVIPFQSAGYFVLSSDGQRYEDGYYSFSHDARLMHKGKVASMDTDLIRTFMDLMDRKPLANENYLALLDNGHMVRLTFAEDGWVQALLFESLSAEPRAYEGHYATFGKYYYLALGEDLRSVMVLRLGDVALQYIDTMSTQTLIPLQNTVRFHPDDRGGSFSLMLRNSDGTYANKNELSIISVLENWNLRQLLEQLTWKPFYNFSEDQVLCRFTIYDGTGADISNAASYYLLTGCRLYQSSTNQVSHVGEQDMTLWQVLTGMLQRQSDPLEASYAGVNQDGMKIELQMMSNGQYKYSAQLKYGSGGTHEYSSGSDYVRLSNSLVLLGWHDGPAYVHLDIQKDKLMYDAARSTPDLAFSQTTEATLVDLHAVSYHIADISFAPKGEDGEISQSFSQTVYLSEKMTYEISRLLRTLKWEKLEGEPSGAYAGSIFFKNADYPYQTATVYSGKRLVRDGYEARLTSSQWSVICEIMTSWQATADLEGKTKLDHSTYALHLNDFCSFNLEIVGVVDGNRITGRYIVYNSDIVVCYGKQGDTFVLKLDNDGMRLLPGYNGIETFAIPDDTLFGFFYS